MEEVGSAHASDRIPESYDGAASADITNLDNEKHDTIEPSPSTDARQCSTATATLDLDKIKAFHDEKQNSTRPSTATSIALAFLDGQSPITSHYLTFETPLPFPSPPPLNVDTPPPPAPDLSKFG